MRWLTIFVEVNKHEKLGMTGNIFITFLEFSTHFSRIFNRFFVQVSAENQPNLFTGSLFWRSICNATYQVPVLRFLNSPAENRLRNDLSNFSGTWRCIGRVYLLMGRGPVQQVPLQLWPAMEWQETRTVKWEKSWRH